MKTYNILVLSLFVLWCWGCQEPDSFEKSKKTELSNIQAKLSDGKGSFTTEHEAPYDDTIKIIIPYYYPENSTNRTPVNSMIVTGTLPNSAILSPKLGLMDLTSPVDLYITASNGEIKHHVLKAEIRKSDKAAIESFELSTGLTGKISETQKKIFLATLDELGTASASVKISPHATISPDPSVPFDYSVPQQFTVTSHSGKEVVYTVEKGMPEKAKEGFTSAKLLWTKNLSEMEYFANHMQVGIAYSDGHLIIPISNEWAATAVLPYYSASNGSFEGSLNVTGVTGRIFQVTNDDKGVILGGTLSWIFAPDFEVWKWNNITALPEKIISWNPTSNGIAWDPNTNWAITVGRKLSVQGDVTKDAVIYATVGTSNKIVRWIIKGGVLQSQQPEIIDTGIAAWDILVKAEPMGNTPNDDYLVVGNGRKPVLFNGKIKKDDFSQDQVIRFSTFGAKAFTFNHCKYLGLADADDSRSSGKLHIYNVNSKFPDGKVLESEAVMATSANANGTGDIAVSPVSEDGFTMKVYCLITNSGIIAYELNCIAVE